MVAVTEDAVYEALEEVIDPELGLDFVSLGLVYDVEIEGPRSSSPSRSPPPPARSAPRSPSRCASSSASIDGVDKVHPKMIFDPPWSPEMMSEDAKFALGF